MNKTLLSIRNLQKTYLMGKTKVEVLKGIDYDIEEGHIIAIIGPSGVGKSTLLHILGALDRPSTGTVQINGQDVFALNDNDLASFRNHHVGFVFQFHHLLPEFTSVENVMMPAMIMGADRRTAQSRAMELLKAVNVEHRYNHKPGELSGGEQQRVAVARALINSPKLLLADEPSGNLDRTSSQSLHQLFWELNNKLNQTIVIVTHNTELAGRADRVLELFDGKIKNNINV
ncbi:ABC transporter ATP-binding protein [candidate division KSB1 bacterium]|nr:ABC transporter ATP-binding protein [candidate division KSB1 bacterium]